MLQVQLEKDQRSLPVYEKRAPGVERSGVEGEMDGRKEKSRGETRGQKRFLFDSFQGIEARPSLMYSSNIDL
jgi:hypothetical protein